MSVLVDYCNLKLKSCPFCGKNNQYVTEEETNIYYHNDKCNAYYVRCHHCGASVRKYATTLEEGVKLAQESWRSRV